MCSTRWISIIVIALALAPGLSRADEAEGVSTDSNAKASIARHDKMNRAAAKKARRKKAKSYQENRDHSWMNDQPADPVDPVPSPSPLPQPEETPKVEIGTVETKTVEIMPLPKIEETHETTTCINVEQTRAQSAPIDVKVIETKIQSLPPVAPAMDDSERRRLLIRIRAAACPSPSELSDPTDTVEIREKIISDLSRDAGPDLRRALESDSEFQSALDRRAEVCARRGRHDTSDSGVTVTTTTTRESRGWGDGFGFGFGFGLGGYGGFGMSGMGGIGVPYAFPYAAYGASSIYSGLYSGLYAGLYSPFPSGGMGYGLGCGCGGFGMGGYSPYGYGGAYGGGAYAPMYPAAGGWNRMF